MKHYRFTIVYEQDEDGRIIALCPGLQGCYAEGESQEEACANIREAVEAHLESRIAHGDPVYAEIYSEAISLAL
ncbi:MAG TPA: type II toxin-antitoxin system HicB family antitoxin [Candidatus Hydrogenedentes bacterium]|nr:type II toxin-antitoxin system HicB family antitoxin [Candidatus Hydrogenedentota bacterium]HNT87973.1 type II toxin-antitoxin system HicB family antitoxin [Candidatus Hydrogenedentota bacterium]